MTYSGMLRKVLSSPTGRLCHNAPKPSFRTSSVFAERDPESSECSMTSFGVWFPRLRGDVVWIPARRPPQADLAGMTNSDPLSGERRKSKRATCDGNNLTLFAITGAAIWLTILLLPWRPLEYERGSGCFLSFARSGPR